MAGRHHGIVGGDGSGCVDGQRTKASAAGAVGGEQCDAHRIAARRPGQRRQCTIGHGTAAIRAAVGMAAADGGQQRVRHGALPFGAKLDRRDMQGVGGIREQRDRRPPIDSGRCERHVVHCCAQSEEAFAAKGVHGAQRAFGHFEDIDTIAADGKAPRLGVVWAGGEDCGRNKRQRAAVAMPVPIVPCCQSGTIARDDQPLVDCTQHPASQHRPAAKPQGAAPVDHSAGGAWREASQCARMVSAVVPTRQPGGPTIAMTRAFQLSAAATSRAMASHS